MIGKGTKDPESEPLCFTYIIFFYPFFLVPRCFKLIAKNLILDGIYLITESSSYMNNFI